MKAARRLKLYRGSRRRLRQITIRDGWSADIWVVIAWILFLLFVVIPWMAEEAP